jgi:hypothetical protein
LVSVECLTTPQGEKEMMTQHELIALDDEIKKNREKHKDVMRVLTFIRVFFLAGFTAGLIMLAVDWIWQDVVSTSYLYFLLTLVIVERLIDPGIANLRNHALLYIYTFNWNLVKNNWANKMHEKDYQTTKNEMTLLYETLYTDLISQKTNPEILKNN